MDKQRERDQIAADILSQNVCSDLAATAKQLVMGKGDLNADLFFVGEAPGAEEDIVGEPFVGDAGKRLTALFDSIQLSRDDVYISNIVKYRPPNNRDPKAKEKKEFWPFLEREIALVDPSIIVTLGRHGLSPFIKNGKITQLHGQAQEMTIAGKNRLLIPMFHPTSTIFSKFAREALPADFIALGERLKRR